MLIWGAEAPWTVRGFYVFWVMGLQVNDTRTLPLFRQNAAQWVSVFVSLASGAFFHTRLMTACHLFVLDAVFAYSSWPIVLGERFAVLPERWQDWLDGGGAARLGQVSFVSAALVLGVGMLAGV